MRKMFDSFDTKAKFGIISGAGLGQYFKFRVSFLPISRGQIVLQR